MASDPLFVLVILSMAVVAIVLLTGIGGFGRGGEFNKKYANKATENSCSICCSDFDSDLCIF